ncbi:hypothetical protein HPB48_021126 [Haemaphysalis longicornis]|uniref:Uncharacterized protein n=1 Tax=Haemaphysalis longicornis TaxID=44386 RepID=A0A9J6FWR7_HAELO|nr:hypothetical protein HPB48_021126 [Haemaphysalis longicornis]
MHSDLPRVVNDLVVVYFMTSSKMAVHGSGAKRKEIYKYEAPWTVYSMNWSVRPDRRFRLALGSFIEEYNNKACRNPLDWRMFQCGKMCLLSYSHCSEGKC